MIQRKNRLPAAFLIVFVALLGPIPTTTAAETELPDAKPVPAVEVIPLPYDRETA